MVNETRITIYNILVHMDYKSDQLQYIYNNLKIN